MLLKLLYIEELEEDGPFWVQMLLQVAATAGSAQERAKAEARRERARTD